MSTTKTQGAIPLLASTLAEAAAKPNLDGPAREALTARLRHEEIAGATFCAGSLTRSGDSVFLAFDDDGSAQLAQVGGAAGVFGLSGGAPHRVNGTTVHVYPFHSTDRGNIAAFAEKIDRAFLPRPQRDQPAIAAGNRHPEISLPAVFGAFADLLQSTGRNLASTVQLSATREMTTDDAIAARDGSNPTAAGHTRVSIKHLYYAGLWSAIRNGYRYGYTAEADHFIVSGANDREIAKSVEWVKEAILHAAGYTKFTTDTSRVFDLRADTRHPQPLSTSEIEELFKKRMTAEEQKWITSAFSKPFDCGSAKYAFDGAEIKRLAVKFAPSLKLNEELFDAILAARHGASFDFEPSLDEADTLTSAKELIFYMHWLKERGRPAQLVPPNLGFKKRQAYPETRAALEKYAYHKMWPETMPRVDGEFSGHPIPELKDRVRELADVARYFDGTLSIHSGSGKQPEVLRSIGAATEGRLNYKISGELQLQLFDVLSESREGSAEYKLYHRMVEACEKFAEAGAFGEESELAAKYRASGHGVYLGDAANGRVDGNLFLVFWLGNMVGSKDNNGRFFKDELDELSPDVLAETRRRNREYVKWLAGHLWG
jgi:hypothetical protein